jgi:hypothetical protein
MNEDRRWTSIDVGNCVRYTLEHQTSHGGFCSYAYPAWGVEEPNTPDTYAALAILDLLRTPVPERDRCLSWLQAQQDDSGGFQTWVIAEATLGALRLLGTEPRRDPRPFLKGLANLFAPVDLARGSGDGWLSRVSRCVGLWRAYEIGLTTPMRDGIAAALGGLRCADGGYGAPDGSLPESAEALGLAIEIGLPIDPELLAYARRCEGMPHGFNITPRAASSGLETQYGGLSILHHFSQRPRHPAAIRQYVAGCQTARGGFGRMLGAIPLFDDTLRALKILSLLSEMNAD